MKAQVEKSELADAWIGVDIPCLVSLVLRSVLACGEEGQLNG